MCEVSDRIKKLIYQGHYWGKDGALLGATLHYIECLKGDDLVKKAEAHIALISTYSSAANFARSRSNLFYPHFFIWSSRAATAYAMAFRLAKSYEDFCVKNGIERSLSGLDCIIPVYTVCPFSRKHAAHLIQKGRDRVEVKFPAAEDALKRSEWIARFLIREAQLAGARKCKLTVKRCTRQALELILQEGINEEVFQRICRQYGSLRRRLHPIIPLSDANAVMQGLTIARKLNSVDALAKFGITP